MKVGARELLFVCWIILVQTRELLVPEEYATLGLAIRDINPEDEIIVSGLQILDSTLSISEKRY